MSKRQASIKADFENPMADEGSGRGKGVFAGLMFLSLIGLIVWFVIHNQESQ